MTDEQLLENAAKAEKNGLVREHGRLIGKLIAEYIPVIRAKAYNFKSGAMERDDLISEGFLGLLNAIRSYDPEKGAFSSFANACISNKMKTAITSTAAKAFSSLSLDDIKAEEITDGNLGTEELIIIKEQNNEMSKLIDELLSEREKEVFYLYLSKYSYAQISKKMGISVKSVDNAISRAKAKLRNHFKDD